MNKEIKEILDRLERIDHKEYSGGFDFADSATFDEGCRCFEERKKLADYITNLKEENERLKEELENTLWDEASVRADVLLEQQDYKSRIDKAIEYIENDLQSFLYSVEYKTLLNILRGDKE